MKMSRCSKGVDKSTVALTLENFWQAGDKSVLTTGCEGELILVLSPWESLHVVGSLRVLVLAGSCTIFGAKLAAASGGAGGGFHDVHAVPPYGPMGVEAGGKSINGSALDREALQQHGVGGRDSSAAQRRAVDELLSEMTPNRQPAVGCVLCLRRWSLPPHVAPRDAKGAGGGGGGGQVTWLKGRGLDAQIRSVMGGARILFPWSNCLVQPLKVPAEWQVL